LNLSPHLSPLGIFFFCVQFQRFACVTCAVTQYVSGSKPFFITFLRICLHWNSFNYVWIRQTITRCFDRRPTNHSAAYKFICSASNCWFHLSNGLSHFGIACSSTTNRLSLYKLVSSPDILFLQAG
jgi:hypothetical protein